MGSGGEAGGGVCVCGGGGMSLGNNPTRSKYGWYDNEFQECRKSV